MGQLKRVEHKGVQLTNIHPNPWNYRAMSDAMFQKEVASFKTFGYINPILVRANPDAVGGFQIIDGEHRWKAAQEIGLTSIDVVELVDADKGTPLDDRTAKKLTIVLNETHGDVKYDELSTLISQLDAEGGHLDLLAQLPFPDAELKALLALFDANSTPLEEVVAEDTEKAYAEDWETAYIRLPPGTKDLLEAAAALATDEIEKIPKEVRVGIGIERIVQLFLATKKVDTETAPDSKKKAKKQAKEEAVAP